MCRWRLRQTHHLKRPGDIANKKWSMELICVHQPNQLGEGFRLATPRLGFYKFPDFGNLDYDQRIL